MAGGKIDIKTTLGPVYRAPVGTFVQIDVPRMRFVMVDGAGDPNDAPAYADAVTVLYAVSYALKFASKAAGCDYVVPPLEALWWSDDPVAFVTRQKDLWRWTTMIHVPDCVTAGMCAAGLAKATEKRPAPPASLRIETLTEGASLQTLHVGPYDAEGPVLARLHDHVMPEAGLTFNGPHHEIYLGDPRRAAPDRLRTILRQPVRPI